MSSIKLTVQKITQPIGEFYITKIKPSDLLSMSIVDRRRIENDEEILGVQRELKREKVLQIQNYLSSVDATFPNSIIVNTESDYVISKSNSEIELAIDENTFTIIDGQHRVEGFRENDINNFELILAVFIDLKIDQQANIFSTINSQQTKVDPSLNLNLELNSEVYTPKKMMIEVAQSFNYDKNSPWHNNIRMLGSGSDGIISLSAFVKPLLNLTYSEKDYYNIRNELMQNKDSFPDFSEMDYNEKRYLFWVFYKKKDFNSIYKILFNYFNSLKIILDKDWLNKDSLLNKTTGYNAIMRLFKDISEIGIDKNDLSYDFYFNKLIPLKELNGLINSDNYGASGLKASNELYIEMKKYVG